jgi:uncharacterized protein
MMIDKGKIIRRQLTDKIISYLGKYPVLALTGPRQSGKTTLLRHIIPDYKYVSLENPDQRAFATDDPVGFLKQYNSRVIFDEVQRVPSLFSYIQSIVDESGEMGQFILSGSQNFQLLESITQSLAGRVALFKLLPFDFVELDNERLLPDNWKSLVLKGFYPAIYQRDIEPVSYYSNYLQTYLQRDVSEIINIHDQKRFDNFLRLCAGRAGQVLNISNLANESSISQPTAKSWLSILESSYIIFQLRPYFENFNKRIVKSSKLYFYDTGLLSFLLGMRQVSDMADSISGNLFENLIVSEIIKRNHHQYLHYDYWFWRDSNGNEVDLLSKQEGGLKLFEIKTTQTVLPKLVKTLEYFSGFVPDEKVIQNLIYGGADNQERTNFNVFGWQMKGNNFY